MKGVLFDVSAFNLKRLRVNFFLSVSIEPNPSLASEENDKNEEVVISIGKKIQEFEVDFKESLKLNSIQGKSTLEINILNQYRWG